MRRTTALLAIASAGLLLTLGGCGSGGSDGGGAQAGGEGVSANRGQSRRPPAATTSPNGAPAPQGSGQGANSGSGSGAEGRNAAGQHPAGGAQGAKSRPHGRGSRLIERVLGMVTSNHSRRRSHKGTGEIERIIAQARKEGIRVIGHRQGGGSGGGIAKALREIGVTGR